MLEFSGATALWMCRKFLQMVFLSNQLIFHWIVWFWRNCQQLSTLIPRSTVEFIYTSALDAAHLSAFGSNPHQKQEVKSLAQSLLQRSGEPWGLDLSERMGDTDMKIGRGLLTPLFAAGALSMMSMGEANAQMNCPPGNFSWNTITNAPFNGECRDQDKIWGFINTTLPVDWINGTGPVPMESQIDVDFAVVPEDVHEIEFKELEHFTPTELNGNVIVGSIFVDDPNDPNRVIDLVSLDTTGFFVNGVDTIVTKEVFADAALTQLLVTLTSTNGSSDFGLLGGGFQQLWYRDTFRLADGHVLLTTTNAFRQVTPEPASLALLGLALVGVGASTRRRAS